MVGLKRNIFLFTAIILIFKFGNCEINSQNDINEIVEEPPSHGVYKFILKKKFKGLDEDDEYDDESEDFFEEGDEEEDVEEDDEENEEEDPLMEEKDRLEAEKIYKEIMGDKVRQSSTITPTGTHWIGLSDTIPISSVNYPDNYSPNEKLRWIFRPAAPDVDRIHIHCPIIRIIRRKDCIRDWLGTYHKRGFRVGERRCGRIDNYSGTFKPPFKVVFRSDDHPRTNIGFICEITALPVYVSTTPYLIGCYVTTLPTLVNSCADIEYHPSLLGCSGSSPLTLTLSICDICEMDFFALYTFSMPLELVLSFPCGGSFSLSGLFFFSSDNIESVIIDTSTPNDVDLGLLDLTSLSSVYFMDPSQPSTCSSTLGPNVCDAPPSSGRKVKNSPPFIRIHDITPYVIDWSQLVNVESIYIDACVSAIDPPASLTSLTTFCLSDEHSCANLSYSSFSNMPVLENVFVDTCLTVFEDDTFNFNSPVLSCVELVIVCATLIQTNFVSIPSTVVNDPCLTEPNWVIWMNTLYFPHIEGCPFYNLVSNECSHLWWITPDGSALDCRTCGNTWLSDISSAVLSNIHAICYDIVTASNMTVITYFSDPLNGQHCGYHYFMFCV